jgi:hypothetical protein
VVAVLYHLNGLYEKIEYAQTTPPPFPSFLGRIIRDSLGKPFIYQVSGRISTGHIFIQKISKSRLPLDKVYFS